MTQQNITTNEKKSYITVEVFGAHTVFTWLNWVPPHHKTRRAIIFNNWTFWPRAPNTHHLICLSKENLFVTLNTAVNTVVSAIKKLWTQDVVSVANQHLSGQWPSTSPSIIPNSHMHVFSRSRVNLHRILSCYPGTTWWLARTNCTLSQS